MFELEEERLEEIANEWDVNIDTVRKYAIMLLDCSFIKDEDTFYRLLETTVNMIDPTRANKQNGILEKSTLTSKEVLTTAIKDTFNDYDDDEINNEVANMLECFKEKSK